MQTLADIVFPLPLEQAFTYVVPEELVPTTQIGCRVIAAFGPRRLTGFIVNLPKRTDVARLKPIEDILDIQPVISSEMLQFARWISGYYLCSLGEVLRATIPSVLTQTSKQIVTLRTQRPEHYIMLLSRSSPRQGQILGFVHRNGKATINQLKKILGIRNLFSSLNQLKEKGLIELKHEFSSGRFKSRIEKYVQLAPFSEGFNASELLQQLKTKAPSQAACVEYLFSKSTRITQKELLSATGASSNTVKMLEKKKIIKISEETVFRDYYESLPIIAPKPVVLNIEQKHALAEISSVLVSSEFKTFLLFGVTGSGKTQVYIEAIAKTLQQGRDAIVLVPEIALTPQTVQRFRSHFREKVAVLHSAMSKGERFDSWCKIKAGRARVVIGPRSAIFAPLKDVGLIVVDEEHETTYKQNDPSPRYHARDLAVFRGAQNNAVVVLGTATPSAESYYNVQISKYKLLELKKRINDVAMPEVKIIDMLKERRLSGGRIEQVFSRLLAQKIEEKIARQEQIILLLNRRGFSSYIKCQQCGFVEECNNCSISLTYHVHGRWLRCHYCGFSKKAPETCPGCTGPDIIFKGLGTQQVEEKVRERFPQARLVRMDLDTTSRKRSHDRILADFASGKFDVLLGTQMVAKGLDFGRVTLVGVINADIGLLIPDFRSSERTFQLLTQVAGRAGRQQLPGEVIIQTYSPESFCLLCAQKHDFLRFYSGEIYERRELFYPPFGRLVCIHLRGEDESRVREAARIYADILKREPGHLQILGPAPSPIARIQKNFRYQILIKGKKEIDAGGKLMRQLVKHSHAVFAEKYSSLKVSVTIDVDPIMIT